MTITFPRRQVLGALGGALAAAALPVRAQAKFPSRPVKLVISQAPGGSSDGIARLWADTASKVLGGPVVVENKPGAGGLIAAQQVLSQPADGYTLFFAGVSQMVLNRYVYQPLPYDPEKDFVGIGMLTTVPFVLATSANSGIKSFDQLLERARKQPGKINFGSAGKGNSTHLVVELLQKQVGIEMTHIPYRGEADGLTALLGGQIDVMAFVLGTALPHVTAGKLVPLMVLAPERVSEMANVPTAADLGIQGFEYMGWTGLVAKAGTPPAIVEQLHRTLSAFHADPAVLARLRSLYALPMSGSASQLLEVTRRDNARWRDVLNSLNLSAK